MMTRRYSFFRFMRSGLCRKTAIVITYSIFLVSIGDANDSRRPLLVILFEGCSARASISDGSVPESPNIAGRIIAGVHSSYREDRESRDRLSMLTQAVPMPRQNSEGTIRPEEEGDVYVGISTNCTGCGEQKPVGIYYGIVGHPMETERTNKEKRAEQLIEELYETHAMREGMVLAMEVYLSMARVLESQYVTVGSCDRIGVGRVDKPAVMIVIRADTVQLEHDSMSGVTRAIYEGIKHYAERVGEMRGRQ